MTKKRESKIFIQRCFWKKQNKWINKCWHKGGKLNLQEFTHSLRYMKRTHKHGTTQSNFLLQSASIQSSSGGLVCAGLKIMGG